MGGIESPQQNGDAETPKRTVVVPLGTILDFLEERSRAITDTVDALNADEPDPSSSPAEMSAHAGALGIAAGRRLELGELAEGLLAQAREVTAPVLPLKEPPQPE